MTRHLRLLALAIAAAFLGGAPAAAQSLTVAKAPRAMVSNDVTRALGFNPVQAGTGIGQNTNQIKLGWSVDGTKLKATVDVTDLGNIALESWVMTQIPASTAAATATKSVLIGSVNAGYATMTSPAGIGQMLGAGNVGLYQHGNGNASLSAAQRTQLWATWGVAGVTATGQGTTVGEVGEFSPVPANYLAYFGGSYPPEVNMNINQTGSYTAGSGDAAPGTVYTNAVSPSDLSAIQSAISSAFAAGARNVAPFLTPNGGGEDLADPFATAPFYANWRTAALAGGAIALDVPPTYFQLRGAAYQAMVAQEIAWANSQHLRSSVTVSPYAATADAAGNSGNMGYDPAFETNTQALYLYLLNAGALPSQWIVENYGQGGTGNDIATDATPNSLNAVALYLARVTTPAPSGTAAPVLSGGAADAGLLDTPVTVAAARAVVPVPAIGPIRASAVAGLGTMGVQDSRSVQITGGSVTNVNIGAIGGYLNNVTISGDSPITTTATPIFQNGIVVQSQNPQGGVFYINGDTPNGVTLWLTKPGGAAVDLRVDSIGKYERPGLVATTNLDANGAVTLGGVVVISTTPALQQGLLLESTVSGSGAYSLNADNPNGTTMTLTRKDGSAADLQVDSIGRYQRASTLAAVNGDFSGALALGGAITIGNGSRSTIQTVPGAAGTLWFDPANNYACHLTPPSASAP